MEPEGRIRDNRRIHRYVFVPHPSSPMLRRSQSGFTFLEVMIALAIVGTAVIAIFSTVNYHAEVAAEHTTTTRMLFLAKEKLAELEMNPENRRGTIPETDFSFETAVENIDDAGFDEKQPVLELKAIIRGDGREVELSQLILDTRE